ncbi:MAG: zf-HC2 domain-containing protein [Bryobacteraceae bacterium]|nr:zf-HC2 domain-containing protein [Bryobacteraceae bacterium]
MNEKLNCADIELLLSDYVDSTLDRETRAAFERHLPECPACAETLAAVQEAMDFTGRCAAIEPPPELITRIMHELPVARKEARRTRGVSGWFSRLLQPVLQPRFAMGMAMTILSFSMLGRATGPLKPIRPADLDPAKVWASIDDQAHRVWNNAVKYYESLKFVYEIQTRLREWSEEEAEQASPAPAAPENSGSGGKK